MTKALMAIIATVGAVIAYLKIRKFSPGVSRHRFKIHIQHDNRKNVYFSKTTPHRRVVRPGDHVLWKIDQEKKLPVGSVIKLRFPDGSCLVDESPDDKGQGSEIESFVQDRPKKKVYSYTVSYIDSGNVEHLLEDPELIIEGNI